MQPQAFTSSAQALAAAEQSADTALKAIKGALIQDRATIGRSGRIVEQEADFALRQALKLVEQIQTARALISNRNQKDAA